MFDDVYNRGILIGKKMCIVVPLTVIKGDGKTRLEFKGTHSQVENLSPKILCIGSTAEKRKVLFHEMCFYACAWTACQGMEDYIRQVVTSTVALLPPGKTGFYLVTFGKTSGWNPELAWVCVTTGDCLSSPEHEPIITLLLSSYFSH